MSPSKSKREIRIITNSQNTEITYGQPSGKLFPKRWPLSNPTRTKNNMNKHKVKRHRNSDTKTGKREPQQNYRIGTVSNEFLGGLNRFYGLNLDPSFQNIKLVVRFPRYNVLSSILTLCDSLLYVRVINLRSFMFKLNAVKLFLIS